MAGGKLRDLIQDPLTDGQTPENKEQKKTTLRDSLTPDLSYGGVSTPTLIGSTGFGESQFDKYIDFENLDRINDIRANLQPWQDQASNMIGQAVVGEIVGGTIEGLGYMLDFEGMVNMATGKEKEYTNWLSEIGGKLREGAQDNMAIYEEKPGEMNLSDPGYWFKNGVSVASSLSMMLPSMAATKALSMIGKGVSRGMGAVKKSFDLANKMGVQAKWATEGISQAIVSRHIENSMEASGTFNDQKEKLLKELNKDTGMPYTEEEATQLASESAAYNYRHGWAMLIQDIPQYLAVGRVFNPVTKKMEGALAKATGKGQVPKWKSNLKGGAGTFVSEGAEEGYQHYIAEKGKALSDLKAGLITEAQFDKKMSETMRSDEAMTSMLFGGLGGNLFQFAGKGVNHAFKSKDRKEMESKMAEVYQSGLNKRAAQIQAGQILVSQADQTEDIEKRQIALEGLMAQTFVEALNEGKIDEAIEAITAANEMTAEEASAFAEEHGVEYNAELAKENTPRVLEMANAIKKMHFKNLNSAANKGLDKNIVSNITMRQYQSKQAAEAIEKTKKKFQETLDSNPITARNNGSYSDRKARIAVNKDATRKAIAFNKSQAKLNKDDKRVSDQYISYNETLQEELEDLQKSERELEVEAKSETEKGSKQSSKEKKAFNNIHKDLVALKTEELLLENMLERNEDDIAFMRTPEHIEVHKNIVTEAYLKNHKTLDEIEGAYEAIKDMPEADKVSVKAMIDKRKAEIKKEIKTAEDKAAAEKLNEEHKAEVARKNANPKNPDNNVNVAVDEALEDENRFEEIDVSEQFADKEDKAENARPKAKTISPLDSPFKDKNNAFEEWKHNGKSKVGTKVTYQISNKGFHMSTAGKDTKEALAINALKLAIATKSDIPQSVYDNLPIQVLFGETNKIYTFLEAKPDESVSKKRMDDWRNNNESERKKIIDALYRGETPTSQIDYSSGGDLITQNDENGKPSENNIKDLSQVSRSKGGPHIIYTDLTGRFMEMDKKTPNQEFAGKLISVGKEEDDTNKPYRGGVFVVLNKADGTPFPVRLNFLKNTSMQSKVLADILMAVVVPPAKGQTKALKYSNPLSFASEEIQAAVKEVMGPELAVLGDDPLISDIVNMFIYVSPKTEGMTSELYMSGNHIVYGGGQRITEANFKNPEEVNKFVDFLTNQKRRQLSLKMWNNPESYPGYKDFVLDNKIVNTNVVVGEPEFQTSEDRRIQMYIGLLPNTQAPAQPKSSPVVTGTNNLGSQTTMELYDAAAIKIDGERATGLSSGATSKMKDKKEREAAIKSIKGISVTKNGETNTSYQIAKPFRGIRIKDAATEDEIIKQIDDIIEGKSKENVVPSQPTNKRRSFNKIPKRGKADKKKPNTDNAVNDSTLKTDSQVKNKKDCK